ncbi:hypothetical protein [Halobaculum litoreum]|nr:hypothetical protein [Halobaculum sp. DT92]
MGTGVAGRLLSIVGRGENRNDFECVGCGRGFDANRQQCPDCEGFDIRRA